jgi:hypothetical protein
LAVRPCAKRRNRGRRASNAFSNPLKWFSRGHADETT